MNNKYHTSINSTHALLSSSLKFIIRPPCVESMFVSMVTENMVRGLDDDETSFLDEVSRQQSLVEKQRRDEEKQELLEYRISFLLCAHF